MKNIFNRYDPVLTWYFLLFAILFSFFLLYGKTGTYLLIDSLHFPLGDRLMKVVTYLGDGTFAAMFALLFVFIRLRLGIFLASTWMLSGFLAQLLKRFVFPGELRPHAFFQNEGISIHLVEGIKIHMKHSFPSGHTTTAFAIFLGLALFVRNIYLKVLLFILACLTGFSRIYLGQHFLSDVLAGSVMGVLTSVILFKFVNGWRQSWLDRPLHKLIKKKK